MRVAQLAVTLKETMADIHTKKESWRQNTIPTMRSNVMCVTSGKRKETTMEASNVKAMREALERLLKWVDVHTSIYSIRVAPIEDDPEAVRNEKDDAVAMSRAALAASPRNCDVGTADDWMARFSVVCERCSGSDCDHRLFKDEEVCDCFARWMQMPYKAKEGGKVE